MLDGRRSASNVVIIGATANGTNRVWKALLELDGRMPDAEDVNTDGAK